MITYSYVKKLSNNKDKEAFNKCLFTVFAFT